MRDDFRYIHEFHNRLSSRARADSFQELYDAALNSILSGLCCHRAAILLCNEQRTMKFVSAQGLSEEYKNAVEGHSPWKADDPNPSRVCISDIATAEVDDSLKNQISREGIRALAFVPILIAGKLAGKFMTYYNAPHDFSDAEVALSLSIARQLAHGINRMRAEHSLRESDQRKDEFLAMLGYELRNPLGVISTIVQLLRMGELPESKTAELQDAIELEVQQMARLLDELLDVSRISRGMIRLEKKPCDFAALVREVVETRRHVLLESGLELNVIVPESPLWVIGDRTRLAQIVGNLLDNANKFTEKGGRVTVELIQEKSTARLH